MILLAGPWVGEFGFEVAIWAPHVRRVARDFDHVVVACEPGHEELYADFADEFIPTPVPKEVVQRDCEFGHTTFELGAGAPRVALSPPAHCDRWLNPYDLRDTMRWPYDHPPFMPDGTFEPPLRKVGKEDGFILVHARSSYKQPIKSWPIEKWEALCDSLIVEGRVIAAIGKTGESMVPKCAMPWQNLTLEQCARLFERSSIIVGPSSGPIHFANHYGVPAVWWCDFSHRWDLAMGTGTEASRCWNPHQLSNVRVGGDWNPTVEDVLDAVQRSLP